MFTLLQTTQPINITIDSVTQLVIAITALFGVILSVINAWHTSKAKKLAVIAKAEAQEVKTQVAVTDAKTEMNSTRITNTNNTINTVRSDLNTTSKNSVTPETITALLNASPGSPTPKPEVSDGVSKESSGGDSESKS